MKIAHTILPHCWICGARFVDSGGQAQREDHHIIPVAYGGKDGPQVSLCDTHHTKIHRIAEQLPKTTYFKFMQGESAQAQSKMMLLATRIANARAMASTDPNKLAMVTMSLDRVAREQVDALKRVYPQARSREAVLRLALDALYKRHFYKG